MSTEIPYQFAHLLPVKKKISLKFDFLLFFMCVFFFFHMYIAPGRGREPIGDKKFITTESLFSLPMCCKFQTDLLKIWFYTHFNDFIHVYSAAARAENPLATNFWCQQESFFTSTVCCKFQNKPLRILILYTFLMFCHMHITVGQGQQPFVDKILMSTERPFHFAHLLQVSKNIFDFIHILPVFIHVYSPGAGADNPLGSEFFILTKPFFSGHLL